MDEKTNVLFRSCAKNAVILIFQPKVKNRVELSRTHYSSGSNFVRNFSLESRLQMARILLLAAKKRKQKLLIYL